MKESEIKQTQKKIKPIVITQTSNKRKLETKWKDMTKTTELKTEIWTESSRN